MNDWILRNHRYWWAYLVLAAAFLFQAVINAVSGHLGIAAMAAVAALFMTALLFRVLEARRKDR